MTDLLKTQVAMPKDWHVRTLEEMTTKIQDGTHFSPKSPDGPCRYVTSKNIRPGRLDLSNCGWISQREHDVIYTRCDVTYGDVLLTKDGVNTGNACLNDQQEPFSLLSSVAFLRVDRAIHSAGFILQYLLSPIGQRRLKDLMSGNAIGRLTLQKIKAFEIPVATPFEQRRIAEILSTLDETIEQTEALIAKYQQIRAGLMQELFTRGVTPDGRLRPTRAEAPDLYKNSPLGWIPKDWVFTTLSECLLGRPKNGYSPREVDEWSGVYALGLSCLTPEGFTPRQLKMVTGSRLTLESALLNEGDLLLSRSNTRELVGLCGVYREVGAPCIYPDLMMRLRPNARANARFLEVLLLSPLLRGRITGAAVGTSGSMVKLNARSVLRLELALPLEGEQLRILKVMDHQREAIRSIEDNLYKLRQLKQGLMHDLLTGRVRVKLTESEEVPA